MLRKSTRSTSMLNKFSAIHSVSTLLYTSEIEKQAQDRALALSNTLTAGLFLALKELSIEGACQAERLGDYLSRQEQKGGTQ
jgi:hypothetical protein